jgi:NAD(P)-dependent dehydrogenase (short-subunit alcohol dehydrogenase family)
MYSPKGKVAVVTGSTRGGGKAIAIELGAAGWTAYVTGRSSKETPSKEGVPGTIEETAEEVTRAGGQGIPLRCDHSHPSDVDRLVAQVQSEQSRIDLLVNNAWGGYEHHKVAEFTLPFWQQPAERWDGMFYRGVFPTILTSSRFGKMFVEQRSGLIVNTVAWLQGAYLGNLYYDAAKSAIVRATMGMATELREHRVAAVAIAPGFVRTERVMAAYEKQPFDLGGTESPRYLARAVRALSNDPKIIDSSGQLLYVGDLARKYGFTDEDGRQPEVFKP